MTILQSIRSRRALASGIALAAGTAAIAAPAVAPPLAANPLDDADVSPSVDGSSGTYESCSAMFGLTDKTNANYVTFSVSGTASPLPEVGNGLTPVLTIDSGGSVEECTPEIGFSDLASWSAYLGIVDNTDLVDLILPYGGSPGYLVPNFAAAPTGLPGSVAPAIPAPELSLRIEPTDPGINVTVNPTSIVYPPAPNEEEAYATIVDEVGGPSSPLGARLTELLAGGNCDDAAPIDIELGQAIVDLTGIPQSWWDATYPTACAEILYGLQLRAVQLQAGVLGLPVSITANGSAPEPTPEPSPGPEPVTPKYTG